MKIKENYLVQFNELINSEDFNFNEYVKSAIFQRRLLNYLNTKGYGYIFRRLMSLFIRREEGYAQVAKTLLQDINIFEREELQDEAIYTSKGMMKYSRKEVLNDLIDNDNLDKNYKVFNFENYIKKFKYTDKNTVDIKECLRWEELIVNTPVLTKNIILYLSNMYKKGVYTKDSPKVLRIINSTLKNEPCTPVELLIESYGRKYTLNYINRLVQCYNYKKDENLDEIINRIVNSHDFYFTEKFINVIYDFYKRYKDMNALDKLCTNCVQYKIPLKTHKISIHDIGELLKFYSNLEKYQEKRKVIISLVDEYSEITLSKNTQELLKI